MLFRAFWSLVVVCACLPSAGRAQPAAQAPVQPSTPPVTQPAAQSAALPDTWPPVTGPLGIFHHYGFERGPRVAPAWNYAGITGGAYVTYPTPPVYPGLLGYGMTRHTIGTSHPHPNGVSIWGPAVPVYGPIPATFGDHDFMREWRSTLGPAFVHYGWVGLYSAAPRPKDKTVSSRAIVGQNAAPFAQPANTGKPLTLSVTVPPSAEVLVDGQRTIQTGGERTYESPPLESGQSYQYTVTARWTENGQVVEVTRMATGVPGEVVRVDFGAPVLAAGK